MTDCEHPYVYEGADVNTAVLQFTYAGRPTQKLSQAAHRLSLLIQLDALFAQVKYRSIGVTHLFIPEYCERCVAECTPERIIDRMTGRLHGSQGEIQPGKALILMNGRLFERGSDIYVQTDIRFLRKDVGEKLSLRIKGPGERYYEFVAQLPVQSVSFAPRPLTEKDINQIRDIYNENAVVRRRPDLSSPGKLMDITRLRNFAYQVTDVRGDWMRIRAFGDGPSGWVHANIAESFGDLRRKMPELDFLEAAAGYLQFRVFQDRGGSESLSYIVNHVGNLSVRFEKAADPRRDVIPLAALKAMAGVLKASSAGFDRGISDGGAADLFVETKALIPYSADAQNLNALSVLYQYCIQAVPGITAQHVVDQLLKAVSVEPANDDALMNLENFYAFLAHHDKPNLLSISKAELMQRLQAVREVRAALASRVSQ